MFRMTPIVECVFLLVSILSPQGEGKPQPTPLGVLWVYPAVYGLAAVGEGCVMD